MSCKKDPLIEITRIQCWQSSCGVPMPETRYICNCVENAEFRPKKNYLLTYIGGMLQELTDI